MQKNSTNELFAIPKEAFQKALSVPKLAETLGAVLLAKKLL
jgi:hypothetical protein